MIPTPPFSLRDLSDPGRLHADDWVWVTPDERDALVEAVNALDALYEDEIRVTADNWGDRTIVLTRAGHALGKFKEREMDA